MITAWAGLTLAAGATFGLSSMASADCGGPSIDHDGGTVRRGTTVTVTGIWWGDDCHDTGPPPPGEGNLGLPLTDIEVYVVQDTGEILVARGNADASYGFEVEVTVPADLEPGAVTIEARAGVFMSADISSNPLRIGPAEPVEVREEVAEFGPADQAVPADATPPGTDPVASEPPGTASEGTDLPATGPPSTEPPSSGTPEATDDSDDGGSAAPWLVGAGLVALAGVGGTVWYRRR